MASLLAKFRIDCSDLILIPDITKKPEDSSIAYFDRLIADFLVPENPEDTESGNLFIHIIIKIVFFNTMLIINLHFSSCIRCRFACGP